MNPRATTLPLRPATVLGRGAVTPFGFGVLPFLAAIRAGRTAIAPRARTAAFDVPTTVAAEFAPDVVDELGGVRALPFAAAVHAATQALAEAGPADGARTALILASTKGDLAGVLDGDVGDGLGLPGRLAERLARHFECANLGAISCACASGLVAATVAARRLHAEQFDRVLVVGVDVLHAFVMAGFGSLHALDPERCRPYDRARRGVSLGEAAAALVLARTPRPGCAQLVGHGGANDACHVTGPDRQGAGLALAAQRAIAAAGLSRADIDVLHLHGTATAANDSTEAIGLAALFAGRTPPAFGTKGQTGHTLGASSVLELLVAIDALHTGIASPNVGLTDPDVDPGLDLVRAPRPLPRARHALKVASGFGGVQAAVVVRA